jgi:GNAT superfamily N-acetyltransferase
MISQAFAYRKPDSSDIQRVHELLNAAYLDEINGPEAFRVSRTEESVSLETVQYLFDDASYQWLVMENPSGNGAFDSDAIVGACCFSTDGVSRRNGEVEGALGSIRFFGIIPKYRGLCIGTRFLNKVEDILFNKSKCCRAMVCLPSTKEKLLAWVQRKNYIRVGSTSYPAQSIGHILKPDIDAVELVQFIKCRPLLHSENDTADDKEKKILALAQSNPEVTTSYSREGEAATELGTSTPGTDLDASDDKNATMRRATSKNQSHLPPHWRDVLPTVPPSHSSTFDNSHTSNTKAAAIDEMTIDSVGEGKNGSSTDSMRKLHPKAAFDPRLMHASELCIHDNFESGTLKDQRAGADEILGVD